MIRIAAAALLALAQTTAVASAATCSGPDPAVTSVAVKSSSPSGALTNYVISGTVVNNGDQAQGKDVLQFVDIYLAGEKLDAKSIPPLAPGQSYTFNYNYARSSSAGAGTTKLRFAIDMTNAPGPGGANCNTDDDSYILTI